MQFRVSLLNGERYRLDAQVDRPLHQSCAFRIAQVLFSAPKTPQCRRPHHQCAHAQNLDLQDPEADLRIRPCGLAPPEQEPETVCPLQTPRCDQRSAAESGAEAWLRPRHNVALRFWRTTNADSRKPL